MWKSIKTPPTKSGIYVVAEFKGNKMVVFSTDYALINEYGEHYWGPNKNTGHSHINVTHWMSWEEYKQVLSELCRQ